MSIYGEAKEVIGLRYKTGECIYTTCEDKAHNRAFWGNHLLEFEILKTIWKALTIETEQKDAIHFDQKN